MVELIQQYSRTSFLDAFEPLSVFLNFWLDSTKRRQFRRYVFEPENPVQHNDFNLYIGMSFFNIVIHNVKLRNGLLNHFKCQSRNILVLKQTKETDQIIQMQDFIVLVILQMNLLMF